MGEYFHWVNVDKRQFLSPSDFDFGPRLHQSMHRGGAPLSALYALLAGEWKGDRILFLGDECKRPFPPGRDVFRILEQQEQQYDGDYFDLIIETYWNVSALFKDAEPHLRPELQSSLDWYKRTGEPDSLFNEYRIDLKVPFEGLFTREGQSFRYVSNHTKKVYYTLPLTVIKHPDHSECTWADPLPVLMACGRSADLGPWAGDIIGVGDEAETGYTLLKEIYLDN